MAILAIDNLVKDHYLGKQRIRALKGISLMIETGAFLAVMGPSGSGKTTLLNMIGCLDSPTSGTILLDGIDINQLSRREVSNLRCKTIGFVFQHFKLIPTLNALENVMLPLRYARVDRKEARRRSIELLEAVQLASRRGHRPSELSGGEQQRVAIARALANRPKLVLADEPTGDMDTVTSSTIIDLMKGFNEAYGQTFIMVTHDETVARQCRMIVRIRDGKLEP